MSKRALSIARIREYFRETSLDEVEVVLTLVQRDVAARQQVTSQTPLPSHKRPRKRKGAGAAGAAVGTAGTLGMLGTPSGRDLDRAAADAAAAANA